MSPTGRRRAAFQDRTITLEGQPEQLSAVSELLSVPTRVEILRALAHAGEPLTINEVARRVEIHASPVRVHLGLLAAEGLVTEASGPYKNARYYTTRLTGIRLVLENFHGEPPGRQGAPSKTVARLRKKAEHLEKDRLKLEKRAADVQRELDAAWAEVETPDA